MSVIDIRRRLDRLQTAQHTGAPTRIVSDTPVGDGRAADALDHWRAYVEQGLATTRNGILYLTAQSEMSEAEWIARHVTPH